METLHAIKKILSGLIIFFVLGVSAQNKDADYFKLYKEGKPIKKKEVFLKYDENFKRSLTNDEEVLVYKNKFVFVNTGKKCSQNKNTVYSKVENLFNIEEKMLNKLILKTEKEHGFKPVYPLTHVALKIHLIKGDSCFVLDWKTQ